MVESQPSKLLVAGSIPVSRSSFERQEVEAWDGPAAADSILKIGLKALVAQG